METSKKRGRPTKTAIPGDRASLGLRVTADLKSRLEQAAEASGRSQSQEAELRLERSFEKEDLLPEVLSLAYGRPMAGILMLLGRAMHDAGSSSGFASTFTLEGSLNWFDDPYAFDQAAQAASRVIEFLRPQGDIVEPKNHPYAADLGVGFANGVLGAVTNEDSQGSLEKDLAPARPLLGPLVNRIRTRKGGNDAR